MNLKYENNRFIDEEEQENEQEEPSCKENVKDLGVVFTKDGLKGNIYCLTIIGQIEGHVMLPGQNKATKYEHIIPLLACIEQDKNVEGVLILLNTVGGDVEAGLAIAEMIASMDKPTVSLVLGGGHSIGIPLAVSGDYSFITPSATMTLHPVRMNGLVIGAQQTYDYFNKVQERVLQFIVRNAKIEYESLKSMLLKTGDMANDVGTILFGDDASKCGLIDEVGGLNAALSKLSSLIKERKNDNSPPPRSGEIDG